MSDDLASARNLGPASAAMLRAAGVRSLEDLKALGAAAAWLRVRALSQPRASLNLLWALEGALVDRDWRDIDPDRRQTLKAETAMTGEDLL